MHEQAKARGSRLRARCAAVAVARGAGNRRLFESLGAIAVESPAEVGAAVAAADADEVVVLANGSDVVSADNVLQTGSLQAGLSAIVAFDPARSAADNLAAMRAAADHVATGAVVARDGGWVGLVADREVAADASFDAVASAVVGQLLASPRDVVTLLGGAGAPPLDRLREELAAQHPEVEYDVHEGGQADVPLLVGAE